MSPHSRRFVAAGLAAVAVALALGLGVLRRPGEPPVEPLAAAPAPATAPQPGTDLERDIAGGESHVYDLTLDAGHVLEGTVEQLGIDVVVTLTNAAGETLTRVDSSTGDLGPEPVLALAPTAGAYRLQVQAFPKQPAARYVLHLETPRLADDRDRARVQAASRFWEAEGLRLERDAPGAREAFRDALERWRALGDRTWQAKTLSQLGRVELSSGRFRQAADAAGEAAKLFRETGNALEEGIALNMHGRCLRSLGELQPALASFRQALVLRRQAGYRHGEAMTLNNLGLIHQILGEAQEAITFYEAALELWEELDLPSQEAIMLHNLGNFQRHLGQLQRALDRLHEADEIWSQLGHVRWRAATLGQIGMVHFEVGDLDQALSHFQRVLELRRKAEDSRGLAVTLVRLARVRGELGDLVEAIELCRRAHAIFVEFEDRRAQAEVLQLSGALRNRLGEPAAARNDLLRALALDREVGDRQHQAETLMELADSERRQGETGAAQRTTRDALEIFESLRGKALSRELRTTYFATLRGHYSFYVDLLMELDGREPGRGWAERALAASEHARARSLLEILNESSIDLRREADPRLLARERTLQRELNAADRLRRRWLEAGSRRGQRPAAAEKLLRELSEELHEVRGRLRSSSPAYALLTDPESATLAELQKQLLDPETVLLQYELGAERSFLWLVSVSSLEVFELPPRDQVEQLSQLAYQLLRRSHRRESAARAQAALCELGRTLLGGVADRLRGKRLLVAAQGALQYVPFAALPSPERLEECPSAPPLVVEHEVLSLPSASALLVLRRQIAGRSEPPGEVAVVADPVFHRGDARVQSGAEAPATSETPPAFDRVATDRLPFSRREGEAILALVSPERSFAAFDFAASKETVVEGRLAGYRLVHFATHGVLDTEHPDLSGVVLSLVDTQGRPRDGLLYAHEIYNLELPSELVVLSACETALGREVRGEGLVGLTRAFMHAGAARVLVSLWRVDDSATAELMEGFYRRVLKEGMRPPAALRHAQIELWRQTGREAPYFWAGFIIQGDWR